MKRKGQRKKLAESKADTSQPNELDSVKGVGLIERIDKLEMSRIVLLICLASLLAYANSLGGRFVFDDNEQIVQNPAVRSWANLGAAFKTHVWAFREHSVGIFVPPPLPYYRPLFTVMLTVEFQLFGLWPAGWHLVSLLLHILCSIILFRIMSLIAHNKLIALFTALLFAVYPVHAESVCWISGMTDPLFGVFYFSSFYFYLKSRSEARQTTKHNESRNSLIGSIVLFVVSAFCKETALTLVLLVFAFEFVESGSGIAVRLKNATRRSLPFLAASLLYLIPRYLVLGDLMWRNPQATARPLSQTLLTLPFVLCSYISHLVWPVGLSVTYDTSFVSSPTSLRFIGPLLLLLGIACMLTVLRKKISHDIWVAILLTFLPLLPVLRLGQISQEEYLVFDHYLYISVAGWAYIVVLVVIALVGRLRNAESVGSVVGGERAAVAAMIVLLLASTVAAAFENLSWADSSALWSNVARVRPQYWAGHYNQALALLDEQRFSEARAALQQAVRLKPEEANVYDALGRADDGLGDSTAAIANFKKALDLNPELFESFNNIGVVYFRLEDHSNAERSFKRAIEINPDSASTHFNLAECFIGQKRYEDAAGELFRVVTLAPNDAEAYYKLGIAYEGMGRRNDAVRSLERARSLSPSDQLDDKIRETLSRVQKQAP